MNLCKNRHSPHVASKLTLALALAFAPVLGACGGGFDDEIEMLLPAQRFAPHDAAPLPPLVDDSGLPQSPLPASVPQRGDELTRAGRYALRAQAEALERALGGAVIWIDVECCVDNAVDTALGTVAGLAAARDLGSSAPVFVTGSDLRMAAAVADQLGSDGHSRVFLVTH
jgi:hypothetical protein